LHNEKFLGWGTYASLVDGSTTVSNFGDAASRKENATVQKVSQEGNPINWKQRTTEQISWNEMEIGDEDSSCDSKHVDPSLHEDGPCPDRSKARSSAGAQTCAPPGWENLCKPVDGCQQLGSVCTRTSSWAERTIAGKDGDAGLSQENVKASRDFGDGPNGGLDSICDEVVTVLVKLTEAVNTRRIVGAGVTRAVEKVLVWAHLKLGYNSEDVTTFCEMLVLSAETLEATEQLRVAAEDTDTGDATATIDKMQKTKRKKKNPGQRRAARAVVENSGNFSSMD